MGRDDEALARRAAREARRAASRARNGDGNADGAPTADDGQAEDPIRAAREAATAAAVGAAVGAVRALTARRRSDDAEDAPAEDEEVEPELSADDGEPEHEEEEQPEPQQRERREPQPRQAASIGQVDQAVQAAREQLRHLNGAEAEAVSSFARTRDGWRVTLEVVEVRRIPETTDVLASYAIELDRDGGLVAYERIRRYQRSEALDGS